MIAEEAFGRKPAGGARKPLSTHSVMRGLLVDSRRCRVLIIQSDTPTPIGYGFPALLAKFGSEVQNAQVVRGLFEAAAYRQDMIRHFRFLDVGTSA